MTSATHQRRRLFQVHANADLFLEVLQQYRRERLYLLHDFVVMPEHIHLLITPQTITLQRAMQLIKGGFSRRLHSNFPVWQKSFTDRRLRDREEFLVARKYVRENPIRAGLCDDASQYRWCSAWDATSSRYPSG